MATTPTRRHLSSSEVQRILTDAYGKHRDFSKGDGINVTQLVRIVLSALRSAGYALPPDTIFDNLQDRLRTLLEKRGDTSMSHGDPNSETNGNGIDLDAGVAEDACLNELVKCLQKAGYAISDSVTWASFPMAFRLCCQGGQREQASDIVDVYNQPLQASSEGMATTALSLHGQDANFARAPRRQKLPEHLSPAAIARILGPRR
jgi:hypothetical protein